MEEIILRDDFIKLGQAIKAAGLVNGVVETQRGKKLFGGEVVEYNGSSILIKK